MQDEHERMLERSLFSACEKILPVHYTGSILDYQNNDFHARFASKMAIAIAHCTCLAIHTHARFASAEYPNQAKQFVCFIQIGMSMMI